MDVGRLAVSISANAAAFQTGVDLAKQKIDELNGATDAVGSGGSPGLDQARAKFDQFKQAATNAGAGLKGAFGAALQGDVTGVASAFKDVKNGLEGLKGQGLTGIVQSAGALPGYLGAAARAASSLGAAMQGAYSVLGSTIERGFDLSKQQRKMAQILGTTNAGGAGVIHLANLVDLDQGEMLGHAQRLQRTIGNALQGDEGANKMLKGLGLDAQQLKGMAGDEQLGAVMAKIKGLGGSAEKTAAIMDVFGRGGASAFKLLDADIGAAVKEAQELGLVLSDAEMKAVSAAHKAKKTSKALVDSIGDSFSLSIAAAAAPLIGFVNDAISAAVRFFQPVLAFARSIISVVGSVVGTVVNVFKAAFALIQPLFDGVKEAFSWVAKVGEGLKEVFGWLLTAAGEVVKLAKAAAAAAPAVGGALAGGLIGLKLGGPLGAAIGATIGAAISSGIIQSIGSALSDGADFYRRSQGGGPRQAVVGGMQGALTAEVARATGLSASATQDQVNAAVKAREEIAKLSDTLSSQVATMGQAKGAAAVYALQQQLVAAGVSRANVAIQTQNLLALQAAVAAGETHRAVEAGVQSMREQVATFGMGADAQAIYRLEQQQATAEAQYARDATIDTLTANERYAAFLALRGIEAQIGQARALAAAREEMERFQRLAQAGAQLVEQQRSPVERFQARMDDLSEMLRSGAIDWENYSLAADAASAALEGTGRAASQAGAAALGAGTAEAAAAINRFTREGQGQRTPEERLADIQRVMEESRAIARQQLDEARRLADLLGENGLGAT